MTEDDLPLPAPRKADYALLASAVEKGAAQAPSLQYTVDEAIESVRLGRFQYALLALTGLCWTAESMEMLLLSFIKAPLQCAWGISDARAALITTSVGFGMLTGATTWGVVADAFGRRSAFILSTAFSFLFGIVSALSINYPMLVVARGLVGFGIGGVPVSFSLIMEFLPAAQRGQWGMALALFWSLGAIFESAVAMGVLPTWGWRWLIAVSSAPLALVLLLSLFVSESPRWLISHGRIDEAQQVVNRVARVNRGALPPGQLGSPNMQLNTNDEGQTSGNGRLGGLLRPGVRLLALKIGVMWFSVAFIYYGLIMLQPELISAENAGRRCSYAAQECGALGTEASCTGNSICSWGTGDTCHPAGALLAEGASTAAKACAFQLTREDFLSTLWASVGELPGVLVAFAVVDRIGRRPLIGYMFGISGIAFVVLLACIGRAAETILFFVARGTSSGAFQSTYLYTNEVYPARIRARAMGVASSVARLGLIVSPLIAQYVANINNAAAMWTYFGASAVAVVAVLLVPIETTRRPLLESMDELIDSLRMSSGAPVDSNAISFAKDPAAHPVLRLFRWNARIDGGAFV